jgi:predicted acyl esterase
MKLENRGVLSAEATSKTLYLHPGGGLTTDAPAEADAYDEWLR